MYVAIAVLQSFLMIFQPTSTAIPESSSYTIFRLTTTRKDTVSQILIETQEVCILRISPIYLF